MPVEIKELVVRAVVQAEGQGAPAPAADQMARVALSEDEKEAMLEACVKEVLRTLRRSKER